jgi:prepilin-type N-terminal cleavage/methylation domain-containing protein
MFTRFSISDQNGFTLIELISVIIILGVLATTVVKKFDILSDTASQRALVAGISELNARESLAWTNMKLSPTGWTSDVDLFTMIDANLGTDYVWTAGPNILGGTVSFESESRVLNRTASTATTWGRWN